MMSPTRRGRILCLVLPDLVLATALRVYPELAGAPVVVGGAPSEPRPVVACSPEALRTGVRPRMRLKAAQALCPEAVFLPKMPEQVRAALAQIAARLAGVSPCVETAADGPAGQVFIALEGLPRLWPDEAALAAHVTALVTTYGPLRTQIGIADSKFAAQVAASHDGLVIVPPGQDACFLRDQPIQRLPAPPAMRDALQALGVDTLGAFAALPANAVVMRFGAEARRLQRLAGGGDDTPVVAPEEARRIAARAIFEGGETVRERLRLSLERALRRLYQRLDRAGLVAHALELTWQIEDGRTLRETLPLQDPLLRLPELQHLLDWHLETLELPAPVTEITLALVDVAPLEGRQLDFFAHRQAGSAGRLLGEVQARWGANGVRQPRLVPSRHIEAAFAWDAPASTVEPGAAPDLRPQPVFRLLPAPHPLRVELVDGRPVALRFGTRREPVVAAGGPWQVCEGWWDVPVERDAYELCTPMAVYYVVYDRLAEQWWLLGAFD